MSVSIANSVTAINVLNPEEASKIAVASGSSRMITSSAVAITSPLDTNNNTLATVVIPGGSMGPNGIIRVTLWVTMSGSTNKLFRLRLGGVTLGTHTLSTSATAQCQYEIANRNNESLQIGQTNSAQSFREFAAGAVFLTTAINTAVDQNLTFEVQKTTGAENYIIERYSVEVIRPLM